MFLVGTVRVGHDDDGVLDVAGDLYIPFSRTSREDQTVLLQLSLTYYNDLVMKFDRGEEEYNNDSNRRLSTRTTRGENVSFVTHDCLKKNTYVMIV
jgi:hypothetical protein